MPIKVAKFGGSSLADAEMFKSVYKIIKSDPERLFIIPSAPGKRSIDDEKITDMLYRAYDINYAGGDPEPIFEKICARYNEIIEGLGLNLSLQSEFDAIKKYFSVRIGRDFFASRGEYLCGIILANLLGYEFIDAADMIFFDEYGNFDDEKTNIILSEKLANVKNAVIPGFYGIGADGAIKTFSRGGSDITGAIVARAAKASIYENWTDVSGFLMASPQIVDSPVPIPKLSYAELREMSYMGANVLHEDAVYPVRRCNIPINIRNTKRPQDNGTFVSNECDIDIGKPSGITGKRGYTLICIEKSMMNRAKSFLFKLFDAFERNGVLPEAFQIGVDNVSIIAKDKYFAAKENIIISEIKEILLPDSISVRKDIALISAVGAGMRENADILCRITAALNGEKIAPICFMKNASGISITAAIDSSELERAIRAIYYAFNL